MRCTPPRTSRSDCPRRSGRSSGGPSRGARAVSVCNAAAGALVERRGFPGRADLIPLGVDVAPLQRCGRRGRPAAPPVVGYAGRLADHKGVDVLLDAVAGMPEVRLTLAGAGPAAGRASSSGPRRPDLAGSGDVPRADSTTHELAAFYRGLDVLAVPSLTTPTWVEQFGRVAVEAMAAGVPVVASDSGALPDVVGEAGLLVPPGNAEILRVRPGGRPRRRRARRAAARGGTASARPNATGGRGRPVRRDVPACDAYREPTDPTPPSAAADPGCRPSSSSPTGPPSCCGGRSAAAPTRSRRTARCTVVDNSSSPQVRDVCRDTGAATSTPGATAGSAAGSTSPSRHLDAEADVLLLNPDAVVSA